MPQKLECILYVPGHRPVSLHRIRRRIGLKMCFSAITTVMHVEHLHMVGVFNSGTVILEIAIFTVSPEKTNGLPTGRPT